MELVSVVTDEEAALAKRMERKLLSLSTASGVLFVGVGVLPSTPTSGPVYEVWVGCSRDVDPRMIPVLVETTLYEEAKAGHEIRTFARMGSIRKIS